MDLSDVQKTVITCLRLRLYLRIAATLTNVSAGSYRDRLVFITACGVFRSGRNNMS